MKKAISFVAAALFFVAGAMNLNAKNRVQEEEVYCYAWLTSCGVEVCYEFPFEMGEDFFVGFLDVLEDVYCN